MTEFWSAVVAGVVGAVAAALVIAFARVLLARLSPFTVVIGSTAVGFVLVALALTLSSNDLLVAAAGTVLSGLIGAGYIALAAER